MPVMDGYEASKQIKQIKARAENRLEKSPGSNPAAPMFYIVAMTALDTKQEREKCLNNGMDAFLSKPPDINDLKKVLRQHISPAILQNCD